MALLAIVALLVLAVSLVYALSERKLRRRYVVPAEEVTARTDSAGLARGRHLYHSITCALCHDADGGGKLYADAGWLGVMAGPVRAIRHGVRRDGTSLILLPSEVFVHLSDEERASDSGPRRTFAPRCARGVVRAAPRSTNSCPGASTAT